jgi:hypothetical protein
MLTFARRLESKEGLNGMRDQTETDAAPLVGGGIRFM